MKKIFGILLLIVGLFLVALGMFGMGKTGAERNCNNSQIEMVQGHQSKYDTEMVLGVGIAIVGLIFHVIGVVLLSTKTKKQLQLETELEVLRKIKT